MKVFTACLSELSEFPQMRESVLQGRPIGISGCVDSQKLHMVYGLSDGFPYKIIATYNEPIRKRKSFKPKQIFTTPKGETVDTVLATRYGTQLEKQTDVGQTLCSRDYKGLRNRDNDNVVAEKISIRQATKKGFIDMNNGG